MRPGSPPRRRTALLLCALLVPLCVVGGVVWLAVGRPAEEAPPETDPTGRPTHAGSPHPQPSTHPDARSTARPLDGRTVVIDPGHNPTNHRHPDEMSRQVDIGTKKKACDTAGTATASGYAEAEFNLDVARRIRTGLERRGATVRLTHDGDRPWGPCIDERAAVGNRHHADAVVSVHADGAGEGHRGFHVIAPKRVDEGAADTTAVTGPSRRLGKELVEAFARATGTRVSGYVGGGDGFVTRDDLGGLNLSKVPKVFLECGNMRDPRDAALLTDRAWRQRAAQGVVKGITAFLTEGGGT